MLKLSKILGGVLVVVGGVFMPGSVMFALAGAALVVQAICEDDDE